MLLQDCQLIQTLIVSPVFIIQHITIKHSKGHMIIIKHLLQFFRLEILAGYGITTAAKT